MRDIPVGNGSLLVTFDDKYRMRDIYYPHIGQENHTEGFPFRFGVWADGEFSWIFEDAWKKTLRYLPETLVTDVHLINEELGIEITCHDTVASHDNIFVRKAYLSNLRDTDRNVRVFLHQDFRIYENNVGDTAYYDPECRALIHYKKDRYFLINTEPHFDNFSTGRKAFGEQEGTWRDAEKGELNGSAKTEGSVDSTIQINLDLKPQGTQNFYYWIAAGKTHGEVFRHNSGIVAVGPQYSLDYTENYWRVWVNKHRRDFADLSEEVIRIFKRSLLIVRTQIDNCGSILAANDSDVTERATDHYSYLWTRDGALVANALDLAHYPYLTRNFFLFCSHIVVDEGYFLQKYNADGTLASGWHASWDSWRKEELVPIQEDETALVLWALWEHYDKFREVEYSHRIYRPIVTRCADFLVSFRDEDTGLPKPSWNLWEDRRGVHTFTCATVVAGLRAAANFARLFGENIYAENYDHAANEIVEGMRKHLYSAEKKRFLRSLEATNGDELVPDPTIDASLFGIFYFGAFDVDDEMVENTMKAVERHLWVDGEIGGVARFENDGYMRVSNDHTGNPWFICTLWLADYRIQVAKKKEDLDGVIEILEWTAKHALKSGVLAEQISPVDGSPVSVSPLTWSHSTFVATVQKYLQKLATFEN